MKSRCQKNGAVFTGFMLVGALVSFSHYVYARDTFDQSKEFPNYFLPKNFESLGDSEKKGILANRRALIEQVLYSVCDRLMLPVVVPPANQLQNVKYFEYVNHALAAKGISAEVMPSGGVVRSALGYIYEQIHSSMLSNPNQDPMEIMQRMIQEKRPIDAIEVRGVNSDFDLLIKVSDEKFDEAVRTIKGVTHSARNHLGAGSDHTSTTRLLFTVDDIKDYDKQTARSVAQGGSTLDYLAFDMKRGRFVEPHQNAYIVDDFIQAKLRYIPPARDAARENNQSTILRGIRPLIELPFLSYRDESRFRSDLNSLIADLDAGKEVNSKALEQVGKAIRNGRRSLGNNRIYRGEANSTESLILKLSKKLKTRGYPFFPEFVLNHPIEMRDPVVKGELNGFPKTLLMSVDTFKREHTTNGHIFHGTPTLDNAMAIMRGGLYMSGGEMDQGQSAEGSGGYSARSREEAKKFSKGMTLELQVRDDPRLNIVNLTPEVLDHPFIKGAQEKASSLGMDLNHYLQRYHGIDIIQAGATMIQNMAALESGDIQERVVSVIDATQGVMHDPNAAASKRLFAFFQYQELRGYAQSLGYSLSNSRESATELAEFEKSLWSETASELSVDWRKGIVFLMEFDEKRRIPESFLRKVLPVFLEGVRDNWSVLLFHFLSRQPDWPDEVWRSIPSILKRANHQERVNVINILIERENWPETAFLDLMALMKDEGMRSVLLPALQSRKNWPDAFWRYITHDLIDSGNPKLIRAACEILQHNQNWPPEVWTRLDILLADPTIWNALSVRGLVWPANAWKLILGSLPTQNDRSGEAYRLTEKITQAIKSQNSIPREAFAEIGRRDLGHARAMAYAVGESFHRETLMNWRSGGLDINAEIQRLRDLMTDPDPAVRNGVLETFTLSEGWPFDTRFTNDFFEQLQALPTDQQRYLWDNIHNGQNYALQKEGLMWSHYGKMAVEACVKKKLNDASE